jgi:hypothetical protein
VEREKERQREREIHLHIPSGILRVHLPNKLPVLQFLTYCLFLGKAQSNATINSDLVQAWESDLILANQFTVINHIDSEKGKIIQSFKEMQKII